MSGLNQGFRTIRLDLVSWFNGNWNVDLSVLASW